MSQQEFMPEPQTQGQQFAVPNESETAYTTQAFVQHTQVGGKAQPKDEPSSNYDEPMIQGIDGSANLDYQHGYTAQIYTTYNQQSPVSASNTPMYGAGQQKKQQQNRPGADGDAYEQHYRPYGPYAGNYAQNPQFQQYQRWNVPSWARPQQQRRGSMNIVLFVIMGLIFLGPLMHLLGVLFTVIGVLFLLLFVPLILFLVVGLPLMIMRAVSGPFTGARVSRPGNRYWMGYRQRRRSMWW
jgi:hypothetical protein